MQTRITWSLLLFTNLLFAQNTILKQFSEALADVAEKANPAVVTVLTEKVYHLNDVHENFPFNFFPRNAPEQEFYGRALGSGVVVDSKMGYILTNNHVIAEADEIQVELIDKRVFSATVIGADPKSDIAVLQVEADDLTAIKIGDSDEVRVGQLVLAVGSPFSANLSHSVTAGIVSALGRSNIISGNNYENFIQTDAAINPGNSGGALLNLDGELIGINTAIATGGYEKSNRGVGFAIPTNMAKKVMNDLITKGYVVRSWLGVYIQEVSDGVAKALNLKTRNGAIVSSVVADSPAAKAGVVEGDVILKFDDITITDPSHLKNIVSASEPKKRSKVKIFRDGKMKEFTVVLEELEDTGSIASATSNPKTTLGLVVQDINRSMVDKYNIDQDETGVVVTNVEPKSEAFRVGIRPGDIIVRVGTKKIKSSRDFISIIDSTENQQSILFLVKRDDTARFFALDNVK